MSDKDSYKSWKSGSLPGAAAVLVVGGVLAYLFAQERLPIPSDLNLAPVALGLAWGWILVQGFDSLRQGLALGANPVPNKIQFSNGEQVDFAMGRIKGSNRAAARASSLLTSWKEGTTAQQVVSLAQFQSQQNRSSAQAGLAFGLILLGTSAWQGASPALTVAGLMALAIVYLARQAVDRQTDQYLENRLLSQLPSGAQAGAGVSTADLSTSIGQAVNGGFERIATALHTPVEDMSRETVAKLENVGRAFGAGTEKLEAALTQHAGAIDQSGGNWSTNMQGVLDGHASKLVAASETIAEQLGKISAMQENIEQVLRVQEAVDGTLSSVTSTEEFKEAFHTLRRHIEESDQLLREISKPRTIRLVESELD